jgi:hypothetical protein
MTPSDIEILRDLGRRLAGIAALPDQQATIGLWKAVNALRPVRPMVMIDQVPWHELNVDDELTLRTEDDFCRELETRLRRQIYQWNHMRADMVVMPLVVVPKVIRDDGFGVGIAQEILAVDPGNEIVSHSFVDQLSTPEDVARIRPPRVWLDVVATAEREAKAHEIFDGILGVQMQGLLPSYELWDEIVQLRTPEIALFDLADRPELMRDIADRWSAAHLRYLDLLEDQGLLGHSQALIHCTGAFTDELPAPGFDPDRPRARDLWTYGMAQIFGSVSKAMHEEFELPYAAAWYGRFGLGYYGCCDPLHDRIDLVRRIPNVRKISISPWADVRLAAERMGGDFVMSRKPSSTPLALDAWEADSSAADIRSTIDLCARNGTPLEVILKDVSTVRYEPQRLFAWERLAMRLVQDD